MKLIISHYRTWLPILLVIIASYFAYTIYHSTEVKRFKRGHQVKKMRVVKVAPIIRSEVEPSWIASGVVIPSEQVNVLSEVSGVIEAVNPLAKPGALLAKGEHLLTIEQTDYLLNLATVEAQLIQAQADFDLEAAERRLAKEELSFMDNVDKSSLEMTLVLREPQFKTAQAKLAIAKVNVEKAQVALQRTQAAMPFRGKITNKNIGLGSKVGQNSTLFDVVNVDTFWVEVKVPRAFLTILNKQAPVTLSQEKLWGVNKTRQASIIGVLPSLDSSDRQAKVLLAVNDPLLLNNKVNLPEHPEVFINDFVNAELKGQKIANAITIKSHWLQTDNSIWVVDKDNKLQKRFLKILFKERDVVYVEDDFHMADQALDEKPGIAVAGVEVKVKENNSEDEQAAKLFKQTLERQSTNTNKNNQRNNGVKS